MILSFISAVSAYGQSATSTASATVTAPMSIVKSADMNFGNIMPGATSGTVVLSTTSNRTTTGGVTLPAQTGTVSAAIFAVNASKNWKIITIPTTITLTRSGGSETMTVNPVSSSPSGNGAQGAGLTNLYIGGTLNVGANQTAGIYISSSFTVTVNFF